ncbi:MAG TPA: hypothetical protein VHZ02_06780 [Acidimicrobiales bacterium]|jgi:hypothetical protein|nr:hypothetical protein [Acidimicrobiales bacterium]
MPDSDDWSPDLPLDTETFEQADEALDEDDGLSPQDANGPDSLAPRNRQLPIDDRELEEAGAELDDPEQLAVLDGGMDDPDGVGGDEVRTRSASPDDEGWDLDAEDAEGRDLDADEDFEN